MKGRARRNGQTPKRVVLILGPHRSGTSSVAQVLSDLGYSPGRDLLGGDTWNPQGYMELRSIVDLHDRFMRDVGVPWHSFHEIPDDVFSGAKAREYQDAINTVLDESFSADDRILIKDPRLCRLLPLWQPVLMRRGLGMVPVLVIRNPLEVADSLLTRDRFPVEHGILLWVAYMLDVHRHLGAWPKHLLKYHSVLADWREAFGPLCSALDVTLGEGKEERVEKRIRSDFRHHLIPESEISVRPESMRWAKAVYESISRHPPDRKVDVIRREFFAAAAGFTPLINHYDRSMNEMNMTAASMQAEIRMRDERLEEKTSLYQTSLAQTLARSEALEAGAQAMARRAESSEARLSSVMAVHEDVLRQLEGAQAAANHAGARAAAREAELDRLRSEVASANAALEISEKRAEREWRRSRSIESNLAELVRRHDAALSAQEKEASKWRAAAEEADRRAALSNDVVAASSKMCATLEVERDRANAQLGESRRTLASALSEGVFGGIAARIPRVIDRLFASTEHPCAMLCDHEVRSIGDGYYSFGPDPQMKLMFVRWPLPRRWVLASWRIVRHDKEPANARLYVDDGDGYREELSFSLGDSGRGVLLRLPDVVLGLRLDPTDRSGRLRIEGVSFREIGVLRCVGRVAMALLLKAVHKPRIVPSLYASMLHGGVGRQSLAVFNDSRMR